MKEKRTRRTDFLSGNSLFDIVVEGIVRRNMVCNMEIWCECFGRSFQLEAYRQLRYCGTYDTDTRLGTQYRASQTVHVRSAAAIQEERLRDKLMGRDNFSPYIRNGLNKTDSKPKHTHTHVDNIGKSCPNLSLVHNMECI